MQSLGRGSRSYIDRSNQYFEWSGSPQLSNMEMRLALSAWNVAHSGFSVAYPFFAFAESYVLDDGVLSP